MIHPYVQRVLSKSPAMHDSQVDWRDFYTCLWEDIEREGLPAVKAQLAANNCRIPWLQVNPLSGKVHIRRRCFDVFVDNQKVFIDTSAPDRSNLLYGIYNRIRIEYTNAKVLEETQYYRSEDSGEVYPLCVWIEYGQICEDCGIAFLPTENTDSLCYTCSREDSPLNYSTKVEDSLGFEDTKEIRFGVELEYEGITARNVYRTLKGHALPKSDGSINDGVEVVTRPARIKTHKEALKNFYSQLSPKGAPNTGMHVHIEKQKLSQYQIGVIIQFMNNPDNINFITKMAGRAFNNNHYCQLHDNHKMTLGLMYDAGAQRLVRRGSGKYSAVNIDKPQTIELRVFSSPDSHAELCAKLDFVQALVDYSTPYSITIPKLEDKFKWETFKTFVRNNRKSYLDLYTFHKETFI